MVMLPVQQWSVAGLAAVGDARGGIGRAEELQHRAHASLRVRGERGVPSNGCDAGLTDRGPERRIWGTGKGEGGN